QIQSQALPTRAFVVDTSVASDFTAGPLKQTGRSLDMAVQGTGYFAVQTPTGEAYTRDGSFEEDENGILHTHSGLQVLGDSGPITLPPDSSIEVGADGTISATQLTGQAISTQVARLKLVNPPEAQLQRGDDGLFRVADGQPAAQDENVKVAGGYLEGSNVSVVEQMVSMISLARQFEFQTKMITTAEDDDRAATAILTH
ncbi:MAG TPA: flagellar basal body rod protein FlgF, partial [Rhodocyclaceae bacterium]|nr:flagellar basal body rod protein FlgF [Rhodocyclaceae bacterium]